MTEPNNKYYKQWLEYENNKKQVKSNYDLDKHKLSIAIDKIKTKEKAKNIFRIGNKIDLYKNSNSHYYNNGNNVKYIIRLHLYYN